MVVFNLVLIYKEMQYITHLGYKLSSVIIHDVNNITRSSQDSVFILYI